MITAETYWLFLLVGVPAYWLLPARLRMGFLAAGSFAYVAALTGWTAAVMLAWTLAFYCAAPLGAKGRRGKITLWLVLAILAYLAWYKYTPAILAILDHRLPGSRVVIPLGISYFTFKLIHYAVEVGRGNITDRSLDRFFTYVFLFPIFTGGPIERFDHFVQNQDERLRISSLVEGLTRIAHGLIKRFVAAELIDQHIDAREFVRELGRHSVLDTWTFCVLSFLFAYLEFSALSDIAIGSSRLFGLRILENFNWPIVARNIGEFWRRWHMTLIGWCQTYVYLPTIGLTRKPYLAVYSTFLTMGLWHGGTLHWVGWGLFHATGVALFQTWTRFKRRRGWTSLDRGPVSYLIGVPITFLFVSAASAFPSVFWAGGSAYESLRILAGLVGFDLR